MGIAKDEKAKKLAESIRTYAKEYDMKTILENAIDELTEEKRKKVEIEEIEHLYHRLNNREKYLVNEILNGYLTEKKRTAFHGQRLAEVIQRYNEKYDENVTVYTLARIIDNYQSFSLDNYYLSEEDLEKIDYEKYKSAMRKLLNTYCTKENEVLKLLCGYLCISTDVILKGKGKEYFINYEKLKKIIDNEGIDVEEFIKQHVEIKFNKDMEGDKKVKKDYEKYIHHNAEIFAENVANLYNIDKDEILISKDYEVYTDGFRMRFMQLSKKNKEKMRVLFENLINME